MAALLAGTLFPWWIAGGHAIDRFLGRTTRSHADLEIGLLRGDQCALYEHLEGFEIFVAHQGELRVLSEAERRHGLAAPLHGLWCQPHGSRAFALEVLLDEGDPREWVFRRDARIRRPFAEVVLRDGGGLPYLAPEIQLLYKAKHPRPKDERDFEAALPALSAARRRWLAEALGVVHAGHPWSARLAD